jgi:uncharacterized membrane protein YebE (DUF533 family)
MFDPQRLLGQVLGEALGGSLGGGRKRDKRRHGALSGLGGLGGGIGKAQLGIGLLGLAFAAYEHYKQPATPAPAATMPATPPPPPPPMRAVDDARVLHLVRAMIAAAAADGGIDADERRALLDRARAAGLADDDLATLEVEIRAPMTARQVGARTPPELREETWAAARIAIDPDTTAEQAFLDELAGELALDAAQRERIVSQAGLA